jgi:hypothetical protein
MIQRMTGEATSPYQGCLAMATCGSSGGEVLRGDAAST